MESAREGSFSTKNAGLGECYPHDNFECNLDFSGYEITGLEIGGEQEFGVKGFSDSSKVKWEVENDSVASWSRSSGSSSVLSTNNVGSTYLTVRDTSLDSCRLRWQFEVTASEDEDSSDVEPIDCGTLNVNYSEEESVENNCFTNAAKTCTPAKVVWNNSWEIPIGSIKSVQLKEIKDKRIDGSYALCEYYTVVQNYSFDYTEYGKELLTDQGYSLDEIPELEIEQEQAFIGTNDTCLFEISDFVNLVENENGFYFSSSDWDAATDCKHGTWAS
jgi:hypothetical protein